MAANPLAHHLAECRAALLVGDIATLEKCAIKIDRAHRNLPKDRETLHAVTQEARRIMPLCAAALQGMADARRAWQTESPALGTYDAAGKKQQLPDRHDKAKGHMANTARTAFIRRT